MLGSEFVLNNNNWNANQQKLKLKNENAALKRKLQEMERQATSLQVSTIQFKNSFRYIAGDYFRYVAGDCSIKQQVHGMKPLFVDKLEGGGKTMLNEFFFYAFSKVSSWQSEFQVTTVATLDDIAQLIMNSTYQPNIRPLPRRNLDPRCLKCHVQVLRRVPHVPPGRCSLLSDRGSARHLEDRQVSCQGP